MMMSEYIDKCKAELEKHGDHLVVDEQNEQLGTPEFLDDDGDPCFVACSVA